MFNLFDASVPKASPCLRCKSSRVIMGTGRAYLTPYKFKAFAFSVISNIIFFENRRAQVCLDCGLFTGTVDVKEANKIFDTYAKSGLKEEVPPRTK